MLQKTLFMTAGLAISLSLNGCFLAVAGGAAGVTAANSGASSLSLGTQVEDSTIKTKALGVLNSFPGLRERNSNVEVTVFNGIVLLLGQVPTKELKTDVAKKVSDIDGVRKVYNQIQVTKRVTFGTYASDSYITTKVKAQMVGKVNPMQFKVVTEKGVVYIMAMTTPAAGKVVSEIARQTSGVRKVVEAYSYIQPHQPAKIKNQAPSGS